jgi:hypothetical protein
VALGIYADTRLDFDQVVSAVDRIRASVPGTRVKVLYVRPWEREGGTVDAMFRNVRRLPVHGADKVLCLVGRRAGDMIAAAVSPIYPLGKADAHRDPSRRRYAVAYVEAVGLDALFYVDQAAVHEFLHLLGDNH